MSSRTVRLTLRFADGEPFTVEADADDTRLRNMASNTDPEYAQVGLTEAQARQTHDVVVAVVRFDETTRTIIDGRPAGFCKLIADRVSRLDVRWRHKARIE